MKYIIEFPEEIDQALERWASATGDNVVHLIQMAVFSYVRSEAQSSRAERLPDLPQDAVETVPPCDLPRNASHPVPTQDGSRRYPDPIVDTA